jgi:hypothetical protein
LLAVGWNTDRVADPSTRDVIARHFRSSDDAELVGRVTFRGGTHVFDFYTRRDRDALTGAAAVAC